MTEGFPGEKSIPPAPNEAAPSLPPRLSFTDLTSNEPEAASAFAQNVAAIGFLDSLQANEGVAGQNQEAVSGLIDIVTDNALRSVGSTPDNRKPDAVLRHPDRVATLLGGIKRHNPEVYADVFDQIATFVQLFSNGKPVAGRAQKILEGFTNVILDAEAGSDPELRAAALAALKQRGVELDAI